MRTLRTMVKAASPKPLRTAIRRSAVIIRRQMIWLGIRRSIKGIAKSDEAALRHSAAKGFALSFRDLDRWRDPILQKAATVRVDGHGVFALRPHCDDLYHVTPSREPAITDAIRRLVRPGDLVVDAGANIGFHTVTAARQVGSKGRVIAIEMLSETADRLRANLALNEVEDRVSLVECALSEHSGEKVTAHLAGGHYGQASIVKDGAASQEECRKIEVETRTLDEVCSSIDGPIRLLKMDLEGAEAMALRGAAAMLARTQSIVFEQLPESERIDVILEAAGFRVDRLSGNDWIAQRD